MMPFDELRALVSFCTGPDASPFYRRLYGMPASAAALEIATQEEWEALPFFTKEDLVRVPITERAFPPWKNIDTILASSGTSGKGIVFSPWSLHDGYRYRLQYHDFPRASLSSMPVASLQDWLLARYAPRSKLIVLDPHPERVRASVRLAKAAGVESMFLLTPHAAITAAAMRDEGVAQDIRFIEIAGERCTRALYSYLRDTFPNATITAIYGSSDVETCPIGIPCRPMDERDPLEVYHGRDCFYLEIIDPLTGAVLPIQGGAEGDLLITSYAGESAAFPLVRYRIGDTVRVVEAECAAHGEWSFEILGRTEMDFVKILGGMLRADEIERALRMFPEKVSDIFELHCFVEETPRGALFKPVLHVDPQRALDLEAFARRIEEAIRVAPSLTYADGVREERYLPFQCVVLEKSIEIKKRKRIVQHE